MSDEDGVREWIDRNTPQFDSIPVERRMSGRAVRQRASRRSRRRRTLTAGSAAIAAAAFAAVLLWNSTDAGQPTSAAAQPVETRGQQKAREKLGAYYSALPEALSAGDSATQLSKLLAMYFTASALKEAQVHVIAQDDGRAAICGYVGPDTTFSVGVPRSVDVDTVRARVTSSADSKPIDVDVDIRTMRIAHWTCPDGAA
ncbi:hypothetical protein [Streptomyces sp. DT9]